jgi:hypothetical protein
LAQLTPRPEQPSSSLGLQTNTTLASSAIGDGS